jgi:hypothetical protein
MEPLTPPTAVPESPCGQSPHVLAASPAAAPHRRGPSETLAVTEIRAVGAEHDRRDELVAREVRRVGHDRDPVGAYPCPAVEIEARRGGRGGGREQRLEGTRELAACFARADRVRGSEATAGVERLRGDERVAAARDRLAHLDLLAHLEAIEVGRGLQPAYELLSNAQ